MFYFKKSYYVRGRLGRRVSADLTHLERYGFAALGLRTVATVERALTLPWWHRRHDQAWTSSCVGHGVVMERAIANREQNRLAQLVRPWAERYDPMFVWENAKANDYWTETNPGDDNGTSVNAGCFVAKTMGLIPVSGMKLVNNRPVPVKPKDVDLSKGIDTYRWASTVDDVRTAISEGSAVIIGVDWYANFDGPEPKNSGRLNTVEYWIGAEGSNLGANRGGHCLVIYGASDRRQAFKLKNSWGEYPLVWMPYSTTEKLIRDYGEFAIVTDR